MGVKLLEYDVEKDSSKREEMEAKGGKGGVPFIDIEGIRFEGFSEQNVKRAIETRRSM